MDIMLELYTGSDITDEQEVEVAKQIYRIASSSNLVSVYEIENVISAIRKRYGDDIRILVVST